MMFFFRSDVTQGSNTASANLETRLASASRTLPADTFSIMLDLIYEGLPDHTGLSQSDVAGLVRLSSVLLRDAPEGERRCALRIQSILNTVQGRPKSVKHTPQGA